jgi:hypothetical protein
MVIYGTENRHLVFLVVSMYVVIQGLFSDHRSIADATDVLKGARKMDVFYVVYNVVLLCPSLATEGALKEASFLSHFFLNVLQQ